MRGMGKEMRLERVAGLDFIPQVLGSYGEVESRAMTPSDMNPPHCRRIPLAAASAREEANRGAHAIIQDRGELGWA